jgi:hypothetical protein
MATRFQDTMSYLTMQRSGHMNKQLLLAISLVLAMAGTGICADVEVSDTFAVGPFTVGTTIVGAYAIDYYAASAAVAGVTAITYPGRLTSAPLAPAANWIPAGGSPTTNCPGTSADPKALPGNLCVYEKGRLNVHAILIPCIEWEGACNIAGAFGSQLAIWSAAAGRTSSQGSWALTPL